MKILANGNGIFEFHLDEKCDQKLILQADNYEGAKKLFLESISMMVDRELQRMFIEFNKKYYTDLKEKDI
jgi:hypothetical protein